MARARPGSGLLRRGPLAALQGQKWARPAMGDVSGHFHTVLGSRMASHVTEHAEEPPDAHSRMRAEGSSLLLSRSCLPPARARPEVRAVSALSALSSGSLAAPWSRSSEGSPDVIGEQEICWET